MVQTLLFTILAIFPLGQIIRIGILHPIDVIAGIGAFYAIYKGIQKPDYFKYLNHFLFIAVFSWLFSLIIYQDIKIFYGLLYLIRLFAYFYFSLLVSDFTKKKINKNLILNSMLSISVVSAVFGWIQLFSIPDIKPFFVFGWDEHLYRLVGTFLDPTYLGMIILFGIILAYFKKSWLVLIFLLISLIFTYSRASYLALFAVMIYYSISQKSFRKYLYIIPLFVVLVINIPTVKNHSISFFRTFSVVARVENYQKTIEIFRKSPIFGIGYNNLCFVKNKFFEVESYQSHSCSGSDSSLLFVISTTGIIGLMIFVQLLYNLWKSSEKLFKLSLIGVLVHSSFSNSIFYPWILIYILIIYSISRTKVNSE